MLICNYSYINQICGHNHSGITNPVWVIAPHTMRGYYGKAQYEDIQEQIKRDGFPTGTNHPYSIIMGDSGALLSATTQINGDGTVTVNVSSGINLLADLDGIGTISAANLSLIVQLAAALSGSGTITTASLVGVVSLQASLAGTGSLTAGLSLISFMNTVMAGSGSLTAGLRGTLSMSAAIYVNQSTATVRELVDGVWNALTADYTNPGSTGEALAAAGSAGDPWLTPLPGAYLPGTAGDIIGNMSSSAIADAVWDELKSGHTTADSYGKIVQDLEILLEELHRVRGLKLGSPATQTLTNLTAGDIDVVVTGDGTTTTTFTRQP
jgi:hypothetical protein